MSFEPASLEPDALVRALHAIAAEKAPPSRVDPDRARADGRRILRHRRTAAGLGGTFAVAVVAVAALGAGHVFGGSRAATPGATATTATTPTASGKGWDPLVAPAVFGWLPADAQNVNYSVAPGPGQGQAALAKGNQQSITDNPAFIWLTALDPSAPAPKAGPANDGFGRILIPAPDVNGRAAYWAVDPAKRDPDLGAAGILYFQSPSGRWANLNAYYLGTDPVTTTLLHVASTARIGGAPVPLPVQISGLPPDATAPVADFERPPTDGDGAWAVGLSFGTASGAVYVHVDVSPYTGPADAGTGSAAKPCKVSNGLQICVQKIGGAGDSLPPGGLDGFLHHITSLGTDPAHWTTDVVITGH